MSFVILVKSINLRALSVLIADVGINLPDSYCEERVRRGLWQSLGTWEARGLAALESIQWCGDNSFRENLGLQVHEGSQDPGDVVSLIYYQTFKW